MAVKQVLTLTQLSQDVAANTSKVRILWTSTQTGGSYNEVDAGPAWEYWVSVNGAAPGNPVVGNAELHKQSTDPIVDVEITVPHDAQGRASVTVKTRMDTRISAGVVELEETLILTDILRASSISATDALIGGKSTVVVGVRNSSYTHSIAYRFGELTGFLDADGNATDTETLMTASVINFTIPEDFYYQIPDAPSGVCTLTCCTYSDGQLLGSNVGTFAATADPEKCRPELILAVVDCNPDTVALTGDDAVLICGKSTARAFLSASVRNGASIREINVCGTTFDVEEAVVDIPNVTTGAFLFSATDSRGYATTREEKMEIIPYFDVVCNISAGRNDPTSGTGWLDIEGTFFKGSFGKEENALSVSYSINGADAIPCTPDASTGGFSARIELTNLIYDKSHSIEVTASDKLSAVTKTVRIQPGIPIFDWGEKDFNFNVPVNLPQLKIQKNNVADWIVEQGRDDIWLYRKWASGLAECWGSRYQEVTDFEQQGNLYVSTQSVGPESYPVRFVERPFEIASVKSSDIPIIAGIASRENTQGMSGSYFAAVGEEVNGDGGLITVITVDFYVAGLWKQEED